MEYEMNRCYYVNCLDAINDIPNNFFDLCITDPPHYDIPNWFNLISLKCKELIFTCGMKNISFYPPYKWIIAWIKPVSTERNRTGGFNCWEPILYYGNKKFMQDYVVVYPSYITYKGALKHPYPKPVDLIKWIIKNLKPKSIFDPFLGSGATAQGAESYNIPWLGFEINKDYRDDIEERVKLGREEHKGKPLGINKSLMDFFG